MDYKIILKESSSEEIDFFFKLHALCKKKIEDNYQKEEDYKYLNLLINFHVSSLSMIVKCFDDNKFKKTLSEAIQNQIKDFMKEV